MYLNSCLKLYFNQIGSSSCILIYCVPRPINSGGRKLQSVNEYREEEASKIFACVRAPIPDFFGDFHIVFGLPLFLIKYTS
jgi:hypothetical protein